ncbi:hypothetical protein QBC38DRAFT_287404 [Podospora fimiseda]|uniref:Thioredoxin domain-containing protein n=1 Tax=Podospora fimiseda TaxID=252190 RepID=A0AAN7H080_9PEZI|nr:hypothetical protein QBC38DRAFT_287404 [Podospora fimiseda]
MPSIQHDPSHLDDIPINTTPTPPPPPYAETNGNGNANINSNGVAIVPPVPKVGDLAPSLGRDITFPYEKPVIVVFLRHCGCPFAEKTFKLFTNFSTHHPEVQCVAVSQSSVRETDNWIIQVGGEWEVHVIVDEHRDLFKRWGLGETSTWYAVNPWTLWRVYKLGTEEGIWNRTGNETGSRWQMGGAFAIDASGFVRWSKPAETADEIVSFHEAVKALKMGRMGSNGRLA